jgi:hypothetical protein
MSEMGMSAPGALRLNVECWREVQSYGDELRRLCDPRREVELDERLKGVYGRMHVQAFKLASLFGALDWLHTEADAPTVTVEHWTAARTIADEWRTSAHRLLEQLDRSGEAVVERRQQDRMLTLIREKGRPGCELRDLYRQMHITAKIGRHMAADLVRAGLIVQVSIDGAEGYAAIEYIHA